MFPDNKQSGGQPAYGPASMPQQNSTGQYDVLPPPSVTARPTGHNPYEFIVNPNTPQKAGLNLPGGNSPIKQLALLVGGIVVVLLVIGVILSLALPSKSSTADLTSLAQKQQELIRVATLGSTQATAQSAKNFAVNVQVSIQSSQNDTLTYLLQHGSKPSTKVLALGHSAATDQTLTSAQAASTYDSTMTSILKNDLTSYETSLQAAYKNASGRNVKALLQKDYTAAALLNQQAQTSLQI